MDHVLCTIDNSCENGAVFPPPPPEDRLVPWRASHFGDSCEICCDPFLDGIPYLLGLNICTMTYFVQSFVQPVCNVS